MGTKIRTRPAGIAGIATAWIVAELAQGYEGAKTLLHHIEDPATHVEINADPDGEDWQPAPTIEAARARVAKLTPSGALPVALAAPGGLFVPPEVVAGVRHTAEMLIAAMAAGKVAIPSVDDLQRGVDHFANLPDLERDPTDTKGAAEGQPLPLDAAQNAAATGADPSTATAETPAPAQSSGKAKAKPQA